MLVILLIAVQVNAQNSDQSDKKLSIMVPKAVASDINFAKVLVGNNKDSVFKSFIKNVGKSPLKIERILVADDENSEFALLSGNFPITIPTGGSKNIEFRFKPTSTGQKSAKISIITTIDTLAYKILGEGIEPKLQVYSKVLNFNKVPIFSKTEETLRSAIKNIGSTKLKINKIDFTNKSFSLAEKINSFELLSAESRDFKVVFAPIDIGRTSGEIKIYYDGSNEPAIIKLFGESTPVYATIKGIVTDTLGNPLYAKVGWELMSENFANVEIGNTKSLATDGSYEFKVPIAENYAFYFEKSGFMDYSDVIILKEQKQEINLNYNIMLKELCVGILVVKNVFFDFKKSELKPESYTQLDRLIEQLNQCPKMRIEVSGHTDNIGLDDFNMKLSQERAASVVNYLIDHGIKSDKISAKGYGKTRPVADNNSEEGRQKNRRVEFTFLE
jgi:flagellar motor protein MotB